MDDTAGFDEETLGDRPSPAAPGFAGRTATGPEGRAAAETLDPADPTPATIASEILPAGPTSGPPLASGTTTAAAGARWRPPTAPHRPSRATRFWASWAEAAWAWSTGPARSGSTAPAP